MTQSTGVGRSQNAPKKGQRGFAAHRDHYDRTGTVPPRSQQCQLPNCINPAIQDPKYRASYSLRLCEYHTDLVIRNGAPIQDDIPWQEFYSARDAIRKQLNKVKASHVVARSLNAVESLPKRCHAKARELEERGRTVSLYLQYGIATAHAVKPLNFLSHHIAFELMLDQGLWAPMPGYIRHKDKAWLRCMNRAWQRGKSPERLTLGPHQAQLFRNLIKDDLQQTTGRTKFALLDARDQGRDVLPSQQAKPWFAERIT